MDVRVTVLGATGRTGGPLLEQVLASGHEPTALVRTPSKLGSMADRVRVLEGDVRDPQRVHEAVEGAGAVLSVLGPAKGDGGDLLTVAARNVVRAMSSAGVRRLVLLTGAGVRDAEDRPKLVDRVFVALLTLVDRRRLRDSERAVAEIRASDLDWTVVRAPRLTDGARTGEYRVSYVGPDSGVRVARADVASFMLRELADRSWSRRMPVVSS